MVTIKKPSQGVRTVATEASEVELNKPGCDVILKKCAKAVMDQKEVIKHQDDLIEHQKLIIQGAEEEVERSQKATKKAITGGVGVSSILLLLLLL